MAYMTRQKTKLLHFLESQKERHISMREILDFARKEEIGTATVYRFLDRLIKEGSLCKFTTEGDGGACFEWHDAGLSLYHFVCSDCGKCFHVNCPHLSAIDAHIADSHGFEVNLTNTVFRGRCSSCAEKETV